MILMFISSGKGPTAKFNYPPQEELTEVLLITTQNASPVVHDYQIPVCELPGEQEEIMNLLGRQIQSLRGDPSVNIAERIFMQGEAGTGKAQCSQL